MADQWYDGKSFDQVEDFRVWQAFKNDSKDAFEFIYLSNIRKLFNYGMKVVADTAIVEDSIQELFVDLWHQRKRLAHTDNIQFYLFKALRWKIIRAIESDHKRAKNIAEFTRGHATMDFPYESLLIGEQITKEKKEKIYRALNDLPSRQKEVIHLIFFKAYSYKQAAEMMSMNLRSVYTLAWKALSSLKKIIMVLLFMAHFLGR